MKTRTALFSLFASLAVVLGANESSLSNTPSNPAGSTDAASASALLASNVAEIAASPTMSQGTKARLIAAAIRNAVETATEGIEDPAIRLNLAVKFAAAAAQAAPQFASIITFTVSNVAGLAGIDGATARIQAAVGAGVQAAIDAGFVVSPTNGQAADTLDFSGPNSSETVVSPSS